MISPWTFIGKEVEPGMCLGSNNNYTTFSGCTERKAKLTLDLACQQLSQAPPSSSPLSNMSTTSISEGTYVSISPGSSINPSPTIHYSPTASVALSPSNCPAEGSIWIITPPGQNATGTCFNGQIKGLSPL